MKRNPQDLEEIAQLTLEHYNQYAAEFWQGTRDHDVSQNIAALLQYIRNEPPFKILDFGCGPGRDLKTFAVLLRRSAIEPLAAGPSTIIMIGAPANTVGIDRHA
jgi:trans-aconitate methyltransferase